MNLFTVQLLLSLWCNLSTALSESADGGRPIYTCANAMTVGVRIGGERGKKQGHQGRSPLQREHSLIL